jgi:ComF family protein
VFSHRVPVEDVYLCHTPHLSFAAGALTTQRWTSPVIAALARAALDLVLPPLCACCDTPVAAPGQLCAPCFQQLAFITEPACRRCGLPFGSDEEAGLSRICRPCTTNPPPWRQARAALVYDAKAKSLILPLKHADRGEIAAVLALHMHRAGAALLARADCLVPVPLHRSRLLRRRYNQAAFLAHAVARRAALPVLADALQRKHATVSLGALNAAERHQLLRGSIVVREARRAALAGRRILLIDDVLTSGATAAACTRALLDAGAANIDVLVASRVPDPRLRTELFDEDAED